MTVAVVDAVLGMALGLLVSAFAATEFQAVQFMPAFVLPQFLLCGLLVPRDQMDDVLQAISSVLPLSYAVDAMRALTTDAEVGAGSWADLGRRRLARACWRWGWARRRCAAVRREPPCRSVVVRRRLPGLRRARGRRGPARRCRSSSSSSAVSGVAMSSSERCAALTPRKSSTSPAAIISPAPT